MAAARSRAYSAAFYDACFPEADSAGQALSRERLRFFYRGAANERYLLAPGVYRTGEKPEDFYNSALSFGNFQKLLADYPAATLHETIPLRSRAAAIWKS